MNRICLVLPRNLPVPAVKGGAIETLVNNLIDINEVRNECELTIVSIYNEEAVKKSKDYSNSKFIFIKLNRYINKISYFIYRFFRKIFKIRIHCLNQYEYKACKQILLNNYDLVINQSADFYSFKSLSKIIGKEKCGAHLHCKISSDSYIESSYGYIISVSDYIKNEWLKTSKISSDRIITLKNCIDINKFNKEMQQEEKEVLRNKFSFTSDDFVIIFCGRIIKNKGVYELISAINNIRDPHIKLLIVGSPNFAIKTRSHYLTGVVNLIKKSNGKVQFTGYVKNEDLYKYYSISDISIIPSIYEDPAPLVPIESMAAGKPLIVTNSGGIPEYVTNDTAIILEKENNLVENLEKEILNLKNDKVKVQKMSEAAKIRVKEFDINRYYENFLSISNWIISKVHSKNS